MILWVNPATNNRFMNKHLLVVDGSPTLEALIAAGRNVFAKRAEAARLSSRRRLRANQRQRLNVLKAEVGTKKPSEQHGNTLMVLSTAGRVALEADIASRGHQSGEYTVKNGVFFAVKENSVEEGLVAKVKLDISPAPGGHHEVYHLDGSTLTAKLRSGIPLSSYAQTTVTQAPGTGGALGLKFTPSGAELGSAFARLKHVSPNVANTMPPPAEIGNVKLIDLSFLDD